jgi:hypothetical protein
LETLFTHEARQQVPLRNNISKAEKISKGTGLDGKTRKENNDFIFSESIHTQSSLKNVYPSSCHMEEMVSRYKGHNTVMIGRIRYFNLFSIHLIHTGYDPSDMGLVNTEIRLQISYMK